MKIDWKALAQSPGYRSLKAAYISDVVNTKKMGRRKTELLKKFQWVIGRAKHYAVRTGTSVEEVLNGWEAKRDYWWLNFYQESNQPKLPSGKPRNVKYRSAKTYLKQNYRSPITIFKQLREVWYRAAVTARHNAGKKARWPMERKVRAAQMREYKQKNL